MNRRLVLALAAPLALAACVSDEEYVAQYCSGLVGAQAQQCALSALQLREMRRQSDLQMLQNIQQSSAAALQTQR